MSLSERLKSFIPTCCWTHIGFLTQCLYICIGFTGFVSAFVTVLQLAEFLSSQVVPDENGDSKKPGLLRGQLYNVLLLSLFWIQHSGMASSWYKSLFEYSEHRCIERSIYIIATSAVIRLIMTHWQPVGNGPLLVLPIQEESGMLWTFFFLLHSVLWLLIYAGCLTMDLPEMLGIKQIYYELCHLALPITYKAPAVQRLYQHMRHPGAICFLLILWLHPVVTYERLLLAYGATLYMWFGFSMDRRDFSYIRDQAQRKLTYLRSRQG